MGDQIGEVEAILIMIEVMIGTPSGVCGYGSSKAPAERPFL